MYFRDRHISDQIGFVYAHTPPLAAVDDFIGRIKEISSQITMRPACVSVILDGENPWETYPNSGKDFLETLYSRLLSKEGIKPITFTKYIEKYPLDSKIKSIYPGSWINGNFDTWIGDQEEADGWDALAKKVTADGQIPDICIGTSIEEDIRYYYTRPVALNDTHGLGAFLMAGAEIIKAKDKLVDMEKRR